MIKKSFFTGLVILLPFTLTLIIVIFVVNFFTNPFQPFVENALSQYALFQGKFFIFSGQQLLHFVSKLIILSFLLVLTFLVGFLGQAVILKTFFRLGDFFIHRIPFINKIYKATQEVVKTLFNSKSNAFSQVVLIPFPNSKAYSIGLITQEQTPEKHSELVSIFIPGTPNPTMGFMLVYKYDEIIFIDMKVEDALKFVVSCGIMFPGFQEATNQGNSQ